MNAVAGEILARVAVDPGKRFIDVVVAALALIFFAPVLLLAALWIKLESPGPVLFRQTRGGLNGRTFTIYKLRSMRCEENGDKVTQARRDDDRITKSGKLLRTTSIDELPQLLNVLKGDMSLVGPRPHAMAHDAYYGALISTYNMRFQAKPGLTGLAQIRGLRGGTTDVEDMAARIKADIAYIDGWSLMSDIRILLLTVPHLLMAENAY
ncbi:exopolysaccharide biosynthesis protein [Caulobacter flavus]|uniref:Exopolysaccharide biosynthesis protein n=3 Tax=Caulobacter TaxID=75 RepID=A0A2T9IZZ7_9CAUL|nr:MULTISPECIES: sugar transferase [Caulobacter]AYV45600.1 exopolysaccharide biosynthesis protein [Caulobacter flavus]PLR10640.1 exopolysaccharide biosynthesis protein [Caulobacter flavus]PLR27682.1 exopolysaccharide biosynthesis protein [Caulobacter zeae]PVM73020.1 exopolysaccharide biosynthesis protein [Caulobacter radicis]